MYKRQQQKRAQSGNDFLPLHLQRIAVISCALRVGKDLRVWSLAEPEQSAVSYTHLDVYKRQTYHHHHDLLPFWTIVHGTSERSIVNDMIEFEYWQLLFFPLFFGLGWAAARIDIRHLVKESRALPRSYFKGLNFLLNEQPDQAIEAFVDAVKVDPQTIELHFALGSLFRRRGETERAIRMHQNLVEREDLPQDLKLQALSELGQDYLKAGLLDRAEDVFNKLRESALVADAKRNLLEIYQLEKDWEKAIAIAVELPDIATQKEIAEYHCELAAAEMIRSRPEVASGLSLIHI